MRILYITNYQKIAQASGGFINDYLNDLLYFGLYELLGANVVDSTPIISLYKDNYQKIDPKYLWGGFTSFWLIEKDFIDRTNIGEKIKDRYYDLIIYGAIRRCSDYYDIVSKVYDANKVILIDGNDDQDILPLHTKHPYFKRELNDRYENVFPISFSIPTPKIAKQRNKRKIKGFGNVLPGIRETYVYKNENDYYLDYNNSFYGITMKKAGWDCMRHYEILANYCVPYFIDLKNCPDLTLTSFPKLLVADAMKLFDSGRMDTQRYYDLLDELFNYTCNNLSTQSVAKRVLEMIS